MISWLSRSPEERALLNPGFSAVLLWHAAHGHGAEGRGGFPFETAFLVLPMVLHRETRESLPKAVTTSLVVWLDEHPLARSVVADRAKKLVSFTKEALTFGGLHGLLAMIDSTITANPTWKRRVNAGLKTSGDEVRFCAKRAEFIGRWFAKAGSGATVMALMGVRP